MQKYKADLHIHTVLSPCADLLMTPGNIIKKALARGLDLIAITDHNSARNVAVALEIARDTDLKIIPGMEVESAEEAHFLCLFDEVEQVMSWQEIVYQALPNKKNDEEYFGYQLVCDINDEYIAKEDRLLATATSLTTSDIVDNVTSLGGLVVPSHVDRPYNSILANLGFIPPELGLSVVEISSNTGLNNVIRKFPQLEDYYYIQNTDSHYLEDIRPLQEIWLERISINEIIKAIKREEGRKVSYLL